MGMSKDAVLDTLARFKVLQDTQNDSKFVAKEAGKGLISDSDVNKLASIERGAQKNPDTSGFATKAALAAYATNENVQSAITAVASIFGGSYTPPTIVEPEPEPTPTNPEDNDDPDEGDETITDQEIHDMFGGNGGN